MMTGFVRWRVVAAVVAGCGIAATASAGDRPLGFDDLMRFRQIEDAVLADGGGWVAYTLAPYRGDGEVVVRSTDGEAEFRVERGETPVISADSRWVVAAVAPSLRACEEAGDDDPPKRGLSILDLRTGGEERIADVEAFALSGDGRWLAYRLYAAEDDGDGDDGEKDCPDEDGDEVELGTELRLRRLVDGSEIAVENVNEFVFAENGAVLAVSLAAPEGEGNGVFVYDQRGRAPQARPLHTAARGRYTNLTWAESVDRLAFVAAVDDDEGEPGDAELWVWNGDGEPRRVASKADAPDGFTLPSANELDWSRDGARVFFGFSIVDPDPDPDPDSDSDGDPDDENGDETPFDPYDVEVILEDRQVDVWHWKDPRIIPNQKERWEEHEKDRVYRAVVHLEGGEVVPLADLEMPEVEPVDNPRFAVGRSDLPYLRELTWNGRFADLYVVDLATGERTRFARRLRGGWSPPEGSLSPDGSHVLFWDDGDWHLYDVESARTRNLSGGLPVSFADEDWDYPADPPGYGHSEWMDDGSGVLLYDKYDAWLASARGGAPTNLTRGVGRAEQIAFRVVDLDPDTETIDPTRPLLVEGYHDREKHDAFYALTAEDGVRKLFGDGKHRLEFVTRAKHADDVVFTRERYDEFPDLWHAGLDLDDPVRLSDANPQIADFAWGSAELVEWTTDDGVELQGVLITPEGRQPGTRVPVLVYYYRFFSQRLHLFNEPVVNHRPSFPVYASHGYAVFLPDIRFQVGAPGPSAVACLTSGIEHLVELGVADPEAIGLHGHSWSGYQTAYVVTQTDAFAAAVAGAPVANMTSAYSGIRWGTGLARQFQYETSQSRIGGSLWEVPERYIENSPVFSADRITTPLLIQFGDEDEAVPWTQGIELYLACRRLDRPCIMLQYRGEPHHLEKTANKLDYSIKMKQFFDHYLKGEPAPVWMTDGVPYRGE